MAGTATRPPNPGTRLRLPDLRAEDARLLDAEAQRRSRCAGGKKSGAPLLAFVRIIRGLAGLERVCRCVVRFAYCNEETFQYRGLLS
jgi:hypothetical protein